MILIEYICKSFLRYFILVVLIASCLLISIGWLEFINKFKAYDLSTVFALAMILLKLPYLLSQLLSCIILITSCIFFGRFWRSNQMIIILNSGISFIQICRVLTYIAVVLALFNLCIFSPLSIRLMNWQEKLEKVSINPSNNPDEYNNIVLSYKQDEANFIVTVGSFNSVNHQLKNVHISINALDDYTIIESPIVSLSGHNLILKDVKISNSYSTKDFATYSCYVEFDKDDLINLTKPVTNSSIWDLISTIRTMKKFSIANLEYYNMLYKFLAKAVTAIANVVIVSFVMRNGHNLTKGSFAANMTLASAIYLIMEIFCNLIIYQAWLVITP